jgi:multiple sugar transport system permease protein
MNTLRTRILSYAFLMPALLTVAALIGYPVYLVLELSFREGRSLNFLRLGELPLGFGNYAQVLTDPSVWRSFQVSLAYVVGAVAPAFLIGLGTALLLNQSFPGRRVLRSLILLPWAVPGVVVSLSFVWMFDPTYGVVNSVIRRLGLGDGDIGWYAAPGTALIAVLIPTIWKAYPLITLMLLASLQTIPADLYEAAAIDGAGTFQRFRFITWPAIRSSAVLAVVLTSEWVFGAFDLIYPTTQGGPSGATETLAIRVYNEAFGFFQMGRASALGVLMLIISSVFLLTVFRRSLRTSFF